MATQGVISILNRDGSVKQKIVVGCDGYRAKRAARLLVSRKAESLEDVYAAVRGLIGCQECLVVMDADRIIYRGDEGEDGIGDLYRKTFADAKFNPRWKRGTCAETIFIHGGDVGEHVPS